MSKQIGKPKPSPVETVTVTFRRDDAEAWASHKAPLSVLDRMRAAVRVKLEHEPDAAEYDEAQMLANRHPLDDLHKHRGNDAEFLLGER